MFPPAVDDRYDARVYAGCGPNVWVRLGWVHPLVEVIRPPGGSVYLIDPDRDWRAVPDGEFLRAAAGYPLGYRAVAHGSAKLSPPPRVTIPLALRPRREPRAEEVWAVGEGLPAFLRNADERTLQACGVALLVTQGGERRAVIRPYRDRAASGTPASPGVGYAVHPGLPGLFLPVGYSLNPSPRRDRLAGSIPTRLAAVGCSQTSRFARRGNSSSTRYPE
jgi:hypothetical protein